MNHYDAIGFTGITDGESISAAIDQVLPLAQAFGDYAVYRDASGAELWTAIDQNNELLAFEPYFSGCLQSVWVSHVEANEYNGTGFAQVWQNGSADGEGDYPFVLDIPDIVSFPASTADTPQKIAVCAFAESAELFADEAAFDAGQEGQEIKWAAQSFIPSGMFIDENAPESTRPAARALFTGVVRRAEKRRNALTGSAFYYCEIATHGGVWSAVYPDAAFNDTPQAGNVIQGEYWLTGRLADLPESEAKAETPGKRGFWQKLLGK